MDPCAASYAKNESFLRVTLHSFSVFHFLSHLCKISTIRLGIVVMCCRVGYLPSRSTEETGETLDSLPGFLRSLPECICPWGLTVCIRFLLRSRRCMHRPILHGSPAAWKSVYFPPMGDCTSTHHSVIVLHLTYRMVQQIMVASVTKVKSRNVPFKVRTHEHCAVIYTGAVR